MCRLAQRMIERSIDTHGHTMCLVYAVYPKHTMPTIPLLVAIDPPFFATPKFTQLNFVFTHRFTVPMPRPAMNEVSIEAFSAESDLVSVLYRLNATWPDLRSRFFGHIFRKLWWRLSVKYADFIQLDFDVYSIHWAHPGKMTHLTSFWDGLEPPTFIL